MKSLVLIIFVLLFSTMSAHAQTQEEIEEALRYYPLEVGNYWEYRVVSQTHPFPPETDYYSIEVVGDTTLANGVTYQKLRSVNSGLLLCRPFFESTVIVNDNGQRVSTYFERADSLTANIYQWNPISENSFNEELIDSLLLEIDEVSFMSRCPVLSDVESVRYWSPVVLFGEQYEESFAIQILAIIPVDYYLVKNFGFAKVVSGEGGGGVTHELIYFRDHLGNEYGEAVNVSTPPTPEVPQRAALLANYPNPFNPTTTIPYELAQAGHVRLEVYDMLGRRVALLVNETRQSGQHSAVFEAANLPSGLYITRLQTADQVFTQKMMLVK